MTPAEVPEQSPSLGAVRVVRGDCFLEAPIFAGRVHLVVADPPYGQILKAAWDVACYERLGALVSQLLVTGGTAYVWGGIGKPGHRPFFEWLASVERNSDLRLWDLITWKKKRAYGKKNAYLFVREECAMLVKGDEGPKTFHVPLLDKKRGYPGYNEKYPAKSEFYRRTNVWDDVTEILRGKIHDAEKPAALAEIMIRTSSNEGDLVLDPFAGSGSTGVAALRVGKRRAVLYELSDCPMHPLEEGSDP
jgi:DNA modification methylase